MTAELVQAALTAPSFRRVRRRVFRQLVSSLVYEGALRTRQNGDEHVVEGVDPAGQEIRYSFHAVRRFGFDRVQLTSEVRRGDREAESLSGFLAEVLGSLDADPDRLTGFARELEETVFKDALSEHVRTQRRTDLRTADYDTLESAITDGHRYHPTYKSRLGFDAADNIAYGPEFARPLRPLWLAAHRSITEVSASQTIDEHYVPAQLDASATAFQRRISETGGDPQDYALVPVHPWQWQERIARAFADQLSTGALILLGEDPHEFVAQQSIRTLACRDDPQRPYLKLSMSIVNTSTSRGLAAHTVRNAPRISDWLREVVTGDEFLRDELRPILLGEVLGTAVNPDAGLLRMDTYGALACIWRESLHRHLAPGEQAVPFTGLTACEVDGAPLIDPWVREMGILEWVRRMVRASVLPLVHLLCRHGIALEAHAQNMVLVHDNGAPTRVALKDFHDGVRFAREHLAAPELCPELAGTPAHHQNRNSFVEADDLALVTDFLLDAFCFVNLGEFAMFLADHYEFGERSFWRVVRDEIRAYQQRFPELADRFALFDVFTPTIEVEKLTTRRLLPDTELRLHTVPNPLAEVDRSRRPLGDHVA
ncbi:siderophore biosynthesis protein [Saccharopolyspora sp. K220]|uniref:IucA/IucC family protein n=1 Tax=Saccharopolyspora soli TaxID=2926618 RepID=UPI001F583050|nr:IucA/IucC family protein [Saccharopolyspora soli]MCI2417284.1 siderophore biosynthesis protein [Saccharopolyspora soli]